MKFRTTFRRLLFVLIACLISISVSLDVVGIFIMYDPGFKQRYPVFYFFPLFFLYYFFGAVSAVVLSGFICLLGLIIHKKMLLRFFVILSIASIIFNAVLVSRLAYDLLDLRSLEAPSATTHPIFTTIMIETLEKATDQPPLWKSIQDNLQCCSLDFVSLFYPFDQDATFNSLDILHTGSKCSSSVRLILEVILTANERYGDVAVSRYKENIELKNIPTNYFCRDVLFGASSNYIIVMGIIYGVITLIQLISIYVSVLLIISKKLFRKTDINQGNETKELPGSIPRSSDVASVSSLRSNQGGRSTGAKVKVRGPSVTAENVPFVSDTALSQRARMSKDAFSGRVAADSMSSAPGEQGVNLSGSGRALVARTSDQIAGASKPTHQRVSSRDSTSRHQRTGSKDVGGRGISNSFDFSKSLMNEPSAPEERQPRMREMSVDNSKPKVHEEVEEEDIHDLYGTKEPEFL